MKLGLDVNTTIIIHELWSIDLRRLGIRVFKDCYNMNCKLVKKEQLRRPIEIGVVEETKGGNLWSIEQVCKKRQKRSSDENGILGVALFDHDISKLSWTHHYPEQWLPPFWYSKEERGKWCLNRKWCIKLCQEKPDMFIFTVSYIFSFLEAMLSLITKILFPRKLQKTLVRPLFFFFSFPASSILRHSNYMNKQLSAMLNHLASVCLPCRSHLFNSFPRVNYLMY